jgi:hypothetical protein
MKIYNLQFTIYKRFLIPVLFIVYCLLFINHASASVTVMVDTGKENINAIEGTLVLPVGASVKQIFTGHSAVIIWVVRPTFNPETHSILFAGLTPGGFRGEYPLFSIDGEMAGAYLKEVKAYRNDGSGTLAKVSTSFQSTVVEEDTVGPEPFKIAISRSPDIFDGGYFLSFDAQDKGTGILQYEYVSTWLFPPSESAKWRVTASPQLLSKPDLFKKINIRASDHNGNSRTVSTPAPYWYATLLIGIIIFLCFALSIRRFFRLHS